ncbi:hypothetical protein ACS0Y3_24190 [Burkholderia gladioli]|uniref:hypothetical protein n=1 Tax=Burkholderia gladioli TaxID=28095 RepID=UPI003F7B0293
MPASVPPLAAIGSDRAAPSPGPYHDRDAPGGLPPAGASLRRFIELPRVVGPMHRFAIAFDKQFRRCGIRSPGRRNTPEMPGKCAPPLASCRLTHAALLRGGADAFERLETTVRKGNFIVFAFVNELQMRIVIGNIPSRVPAWGRCVGRPDAINRI